MDRRQRAPAVNSPERLSHTFPMDGPMSNVLLIPLGVGEAFTARHYTSCLALGVDDHWLLIDCPHPLRKMLREASIAAGLPDPMDIDRFDAAVVTHLHADHCCGLEDFGYYSFFALGRRAKLLMHPEASARLWDGLLAAGMETIQSRPDEPPGRKSLDDYFELIDLETSRPIACGPFSIECRRTFHAVPTYALRITTTAQSRLHTTRPIIRPDRVAPRRPDRP